MTTKTLKEIRQRLGYEENDETHDEEIMNMSLDDKMDAILGWHLGYSGWWSSVKEWMKECGYKFDN